jgi:predicted DNA binding protein
MVYELSVKLTHNCIFTDFSEAFGKKQLLHYCSKFNDYLVVPGKLNKGQKILAKENFGKFGNLEFRSIGKPSEHTYVTFDCVCDNYEEQYITPKIRALGGTISFPHIYINGWEYYTVFTKSKDQANSVIEMLESEVEVQILDLKDLGDDWLLTQSGILNQLITDLTPKQLNILTTAFEKGYYNIPRSIRTLDISEQLGITRYAVDKTLRSAENKIINYIMPFLYLHQDLKLKPVILDKFPEKMLV